jgi:hypothetical protein
MTTKYVEVKFRNTRTEEVIGKVETELQGNDLADAGVVPETWMERFFGNEEAQHWEVEDVTEITKDKALRRAREVDINTDTFLIDADAIEQADVANDETHVA